MKRICIWVLVVIHLFGYSAFATSGETSISWTPGKILPKKSRYSGQIDRCIEANKKGTSKSIQDYLCPGGKLSPQEIAYQVILDLEFKKVDTDVETDLASLQSSSTKDIGVINDAISQWFDTTKSDAKYPGKYAEICDATIIAEAVKHFGSISTDANTASFISGQAKCRTLVNKKINAYKESAWLLGRGTIVKSFAEDKHDYMKELKDIYQKFLTKWSILVGQLATIKDKWPTKTKTVQ